MRNRGVAATSELFRGRQRPSQYYLVGGHLGDSRTYTPADQNLLLIFTPADGAIHPPVEENSFKGRTEISFAKFRCLKYLGFGWELCRRLIILKDSSGKSCYFFKMCLQIVYLKTTLMFVVNYFNLLLLYFGIMYHSMVSQIFTLVSLDKFLQEEYTLKASLKGNTVGHNSFTSHISSSNDALTACLFLNIPPFKVRHFTSHFRFCQSHVTGGQ